MCLSDLPEMFNKNHYSTEFENAKTLTIYLNDVPEIFDI